MKGKFGRGMEGSGFGGDRRPPMILLVASLFCFFLFGGVAVFALRKGETKEQAKAPPVQRVMDKAPPVDMVDVLVPVKDIEPGQAIDPSLLAKTSMPRAQVPVNAVRQREEVNGKFARAIIPARQPVLKSLLTQERPSNPLVANIPEGYRAVTINVSATSGVEGWARAGGRVDVQWVSDVLNKRTIMTVVQNVKILSAERRLDPNADPSVPIPTTITLLVNERDAQKISLTSTSGSLVLHLRGPGDNEIVATNLSALTVKDLYEIGDRSFNAALEGIAKIKQSDGTYAEWAIVEGNLMRRDKVTDAQPSHKLPEAAN